MAPFFSIIIATYNRKETVLTAIQSVLSQDYSDFEIVLVDDGSTDGTAEYLLPNFENEPRLRIISQENKERGAARNLGIRTASGTYLVFMDSDDYIEPDHLSTLKSCIVQENYPELLTTKFDIVKTDGRRDAAPICKLTQGFYDYRLLLEGNTLGMYIAMRRDLPDFCYFEEDRSYAIVEDWLFNFSNLRNRKIFLVNKITYHVLDHSGRSMNSASDVLLPKIRSAGEYLLQRMNLPITDRQKLTVFIDYLAAVHLYIDGKRRRSMKLTLGLLRSDGIRKKYLLLLIKCMAGKQIIDRIRKLTGR